MNVYAIIAHLHRIGIHPRIDSTGSLLLRVKPGAMTDEIKAMIEPNKAAIIAHLQADPLLRSLTDDEKAAIDVAFGELRNQHGPALHAAGWVRSIIFDGLDPTKCEKAGDVPGIIGLLMGGGRLVAIHPDRLDLEFSDGTPFSTIKSGVSIGGTELAKYLTDLQSTERKNDD